MTRRVFVAVLVLGALALVVWRAELFTVQKPGERPRPLVAVPESSRRAVALDVVLPAVPVGMRRFRGGEGVLLIHYWAPWQKDAAAQAAGLDSLQHLAAVSGVGATVVCFDPFPSVARYVARRGLRLGVALDPQRAMRTALPCPSIPFTYVLDARGRVAVEQAGEVDWLAPGTVETLSRLRSERRPEPSPS